jgi:hypothetical protein
VAWNIQPPAEQLEVSDPEDLQIFGPQEAVQLTPGARHTGNQQPWKLELQRDLAAPKAAMSSDILKWWDFNALQHPIYLVKIARDYAGIPGSSVPSEWVFSRAGGLVTRKRNLLAPESAASIVCLRYWLGLPEVTEDEMKRLEESLKEGKEHEFLVEHYLPEDDGPGDAIEGSLEDEGSY